MIKNLDELIKGDFSKERRDALDIIENVLKKMNGYNIIKDVIKIENDFMIIKDKKINLASYKKFFLIGFGKASATMAKAMEEMIYFDEGAIITTEKIKLKSIKVFVGSHPFPSNENIRASEYILNIVKKADKNDLIFVLISGGGSSLFCLPRISLDSIIDVTSKLMKSGCSIEELNIVRKHLSYIKGGQLAKATKGKIISLIISDIIGNPIDAIASGPTARDKSTFKDAYEIMKKYRVENEEALNVIKKGMEGKIEDTPKEIRNAENIIIADIEKACKEAERLAKEKGYYPKILSCNLKGEAKEIGKALARYTKFYPRYHTIIIAGGETIVKVKGNGIGGRNQEMVLAALKEIDGMPIVFASIGTDGIDGNSKAAGAIADGESMERAMALHLNPDEFLENNDSYTFFEKLKDAIITGYTGTNVMDLQIILKR